MVEEYTKYKLNEKEYYKCVKCDFYTIYISSIKRHNNHNNCKDISICEYCKKEFRSKLDKERHINKKKKCYIMCEKIIEKEIKEKEEENINELKGRIEELIKENDILNEENNKKENTIKILEDQKREIKIFTYNKLSNALLERERNKNMLINDIEYYILYNAITQYKDKNDDDDKIKDKLYLSMSYMKEERYNDFFKSVKKDYNYLIPFIIDYYNYLKGIDDKKINGKNRETFISDLNTKIKVYLKIDNI